jgi:hypothetical protein
MKVLLAALVSICCAIATAHANEATVYESCTDSTGKTVVAEIDYALPVLVRSIEDPAQPTIRYNPSLLPRLKPATRLFFFARECGRHASHGLDAGAEVSLAQSREADCAAVATMLGGGLLQRADVQALQGDLRFSPDEWKLLPGPVRDFDFSACPRRDVLKMPLPTLPTVQQASWNACVRICGDRLRTCQKPCRGESCDSLCLAVYDQCEAACAKRPAE